jgi:hypothetical protein
MGNGIVGLEDNYDPNDPKNGGVTYEPGKSAMLVVIKANGTIVQTLPVFQMV